jgi:endonuclease YncB( thermonuclease family)
MFEYRARVVQVVDSTTLDLEIDLGFKCYTKQRVKLWGIKATDETSSVGLDRLNELVNDKEVVIQTKFSRRIKLGRVLGVLWLYDQKSKTLKGACINDQLVKEKLAKQFESIDM